MELAPRQPWPPERVRPYLPWVAFAGLALLFELPTVMRPDRVDPTAMRPTGEMLAVLTVYATCRVVRAPRFVYGLLLLVTIALVIVRLDWAVYFLVTRSEPLLYDQLFMLHHLIVLVSDLWSFGTALVVLGFFAGCAALVLAARRLLRVADPLFEVENRKRLAAAGAVTWAVVLGLSTLAPVSKAGDPTVHWLTRDVVHNVLQSRSIYAEVEKAVTESPYRGYDQIELRRKPNISILFVESYGRIVADSDDLRPRWEARLRDMETRLGSAGWHLASGYSTAPVSGGRSWLAVTSILTGTHVEYESVFRHMLKRMDEIPSLVKFVKNRGYHTISLEPSDRVRPGVEEANYHGFAKMLRFNDIGYHGPKAGWGLVPDEYSLGFATDHALGPESSPRLFTFHMVTSHMPWRQIPSYSGDWRALNDAKGDPIDTLDNGELLPRMARYGREASHRWVFYGGLGDDYRARYIESIDYDLKVIEEHLLRSTDDDLMIVMGDHQPAAIAPEKTNFDVPVHLFARDPALLDEFRDHGFRDGLEPARTDPPAIEHGGFFSLIVRALVRCCGAGTPPTYLRSGVPMGA